MISAEPQFEICNINGITEWMTRFCGRNDKQVVIIEALFEERNFLRRFTVELAKCLTEHQIAVTLCDLPGTGDSPGQMRDLTLWAQAITDVTAHIAQQTGTLPHLVSLRGGALIDNVATAASRWRFAPADGFTLLRPIERALRISGNNVDEGLAALGIDAVMRHSIEQAAILPPQGACRTVPMKPGVTPLWRLSEPGNDKMLAEELARDIAQWIEACAAH